jgi:membrane protease YdiL (CAAX protease family)
MMWLVLPYLLPLSIIVVANLGVTRRRWRQLTYVSLGLLCAASWIGGLLLLALPYFQRLTQAPPELVLQGLRLRGYGVALAASTILSLACLATPVRSLLARWFPIDPASPVHATALVFAIYLAASSLALLTSSGEWLLAGIRVSNIDLELLVLGQAVFLLFALAGVGLGIRRNLRQVLSRLDLRALTLRQLGTAVLVIVTFLALDWVVAQLWRQLWPVNYRAVTEASEHLFGRFASPMGALLLGLSAGIGEETLFRGALQPRLRIPLTAVVFALGHVQYTLSPAILEILVIGLALGWLRERTNTTACIVVHTGYNFLNVLLLPYWT